MATCPWCDHGDDPNGCPYLDHVGNLRGDQECPTVCGQPATHTLIYPIGTLRLCGTHFRAAMTLLAEEAH